MTSTHGVHDNKRSSAPAGGALLSQLRQGTHALHGHMETLPALKRVFAHDYRRSEYVTLLQAFHAVIRPLEAALLDAVPAVAGELGYRPRCADLQSDLLALAADFPVVDQRVPGALTGSAAAQVGCLYVLEGSRFGGKQIARRLAGTLGLNPERGLRFFAGAPDSPGPDWREFCCCAESLCRSSSARRTAVVGAAATFTLFHQRLDDDCRVA